MTHRCLALTAVLLVAATSAIAGAPAILDPGDQWSHKPNHGGRGGGSPGNGFDPVTLDFQDGIGHGVLSDGRAAYTDDVCGVNAEIDHGKALAPIKHRSCCGTWTWAASHH